MLPLTEISMGHAAHCRVHAPAQHYPPAEATHEAVCEDAGLFLATLESLQRLLGINEKWRDAAEPFHFPETITSVSYSLRKAYINHLWDYEQVYFFRRQGPRLVSPAGTANVGTGGFEDDLSRPGKKRKTNDVVATSFPAVHPCSPITLTAASTGPGSPTAAAVGQRGTVVVESRFDAGYFVAVRIGKQDFRGMLYFPPAESTTLVDLTPLAQPRRAGRPRKEERQDGARVIKKEK
ncbi:hypothetical protein WJX84_006368, partial [Apatococcus fuscideae]